MSDDSSERVKCPSCAEPIAAEARVCPHCRSRVLVDVTLDGPVADPRVRYRAARALAALSPARPALTDLQSRLTAARPTVAARVTMLEAQKTIETLASVGLTARARAGAEASSLYQTSPSVATEEHSSRTWLLGLVAVVALAAGAFWLTQRSREATKTDATTDGKSAAAERPTLSTQELAERVLPSTVAVHCGNGVGAGFFVTEHIVVTNAHVVDQGCTRVVVNLADGQQASGPVAHRFRQVDLALVEIPDMTGTPLPLGDAGAIKVGERILLIGSPQALEFTVHEGLISSVSRSNMGTAYLQLDAKINPGNSGGPVVNTRGEVVGVVTLKLAEAEGIGFALPINYLFAEQTGLLPAPAEADASRFAAMIERASVEEEKATSSVTEAWDQPALIKAERHQRYTQYGTRQEYVLYIAQFSQSLPVGVVHELNVSVGNVQICSLSREVVEWETIQGATASAFTDRATADWLRRKNLDAQIYVGRIYVPRPPCPDQPDRQLSVIELVGADPTHAQARLY